MYETTCSRQRAADSVQQTATTDNVQQTKKQKTTCIRQLYETTCSRNHAADNAGGNVAHAAATKAADDEQRTTCNVQKTASTRQAATGNM
jgi:hypothetical protein